MKARNYQNDKALEICKRISKNHGISLQDLCKKNRGFQHEADARAYAMHSIRVELGWTWQRIATFFGKRNHSTAIKAYDKIENMKSIENESLRKERGVAR